MEAMRSAGFETFWQFFRTLEWITLALNGERDDADGGNGREAMLTRAIRLLQN